MDAPNIGSAAPVAGEWTPWNGGVNPAPGQDVDYKLRKGTAYHFRPSEILEWDHDNDPGDIIAFRLSRPAEAPAPAALDGGVREAALNLWALLSEDHLRGPQPIPGLGLVSWDNLRAILAALATKPGGEGERGLVEALKAERALLDRAEEELRLIRAKDSGAVYDTTLRTDFGLNRAARKQAALSDTQGRK